MTLPIFVANAGTSLTSILDPEDAPAIELLDFHCHLILRQFLSKFLASVAQSHLSRAATELVSRSPIATSFPDWSWGRIAIRRVARGDLRGSAGDDLNCRCVAPYVDSDQDFVRIMSSNLTSSVSIRP